MSKKNNRNRGIEGRERRLKCPVCLERTGFQADRQSFGGKNEHSLSSRPGDLTQCDHCLTMLEYRGDATSLTLHVAPRERVEAFNRLSREGYREPTVPELIAYVRKYRQMPQQPRDLLRRLQPTPIEILNER